jgi:hypothetical protein
MNAMPQLSPRPWGTRTAAVQFDGAQWGNVKVPLLLEAQLALIVDIYKKSMVYANKNAFIKDKCLNW